MSCCIPWFLCAICGEDYPLNELELVDEHYICQECAKKQEEKQVDRVNN